MRPLKMIPGANPMRHMRKILFGLALIFASAVPAHAGGHAKDQQCRRLELPWTPLPNELMRLRTSHRGASLPVAATRLVRDGKSFSVVKPRDDQHRSSRANWRIEFQEIAGAIRARSGDVSLRIDHIGSTSVPFLCAKDVIDLQVTVAKLDGDVAERLRQLGFVQLPEIQGDHVPPGYAGPKSDWAKHSFVEPSGHAASMFTSVRPGDPISAMPCSFATISSRTRERLRLMGNSSNAWQRLWSARMLMPMSKTQRLISSTSPRRNGLTVRDGNCPGTEHRRREA